MTERFPSVFVSHGAPFLAIEPSPTRDFLSGLGTMLGRPRAILVISAHWDTGEARVSAAGRPETIHDFYGFPEALYQLAYPAAGSPELAARVKALLDAGGIECRIDQQRGLDHGAWVPLMLMYPDAGIPVVQLSVQSRLGAAHHRRLGVALRPLRDEGVLILGSGGATHNLAEFGRHGRDAPSPSWVTDFQTWLEQTVAGGRLDDLVDYRVRAPHGARNHPSEEHFVPLIVAAAAGSEGAAGKLLHDRREFAVLAMDAFRFD